MTISFESLNVACTDLISERVSWESNELAASNARLYKILAACYELYRTYATAKEGRDLINKLAERHRITTDRTTPASIKLIKVVFGSEPRWRASSYSQVFRIAEAQGVLPADFAKWIQDNGGCEAIRRGTPKSADQRLLEEQAEYQKGIDCLAATVPLCVFTPELRIFEKAGYALLLCHVNADGKITIYNAASVPDDSHTTAAIRRTGKAALKPHAANAITIRLDKIAEEKAAASITTAIEDGQLADFSNSEMLAVA
ncbi:MAG: hypothetical protein OEL53_08960 [Rhodospirillales bacterium]|nr:hypothetical protein [Rhodospirillales bacterium]